MVGGYLLSSQGSYFDSLKGTQEAMQVVRMGVILAAAEG